MKNSDLPWVLPLLTAWSQGETLQFYDEDCGVWTDWKHYSAPRFDSPRGAADYRIKPELKTPEQVYLEAAYPECKGNWSRVVTGPIKRGVLEVIRAYNNGDLQLPEDF